MKKLLIILFSAISLTAMAQNKKTVAVLDPICRDNSVNIFFQQIVRGTMESTVGSTDEYETFDRTALDAIMSEHNFQRSGAVKDEQIRRLGELAGVNYVLVTEVSADDNYINVIVKIVNIETGQSSKPKSELMEKTPPVVQNSCRALAAQVFGIIDTNTGQRKGELQLEEGRYVGEILKGKPHGKGKMYYADNNEYGRASYEGDWVDGNCTGQGTMIWKNGEKYIGSLKDDKRNGYGTEYFADGGRYEGYFENNQIKGKGKMYYAANEDNIVSYDGDWGDGLPYGQGTMIWKDGEKYIGNWKNGIRNGYGIQYYTNGNRYEGNWKDNELDGKGTFYWKDGDRYEGDFKNDSRHGQGTYYWIDGRKYVGGWENDKKSGYGTFFMSNCREEGTWKNGKENGKFTIYWSDGDKDIGNFVNGEQDGDWIRISQDGKKRKTKYSMGKLVRDWHM